MKMYQRDAQRREKKRLTITIIVLVAVAILGAVLYMAARAYAFEQRGYIAYGGEMFFLAIPPYAVYKIARTIWEYNNDRKEEPRC